VLPGALINSELETFFIFQQHKFFFFLAYNETVPVLVQWHMTDCVAATTAAAVAAVATASLAANEARSCCHVTRQCFVQPVVRTQKLPPVCAAIAHCTSSTPLQQGSTAWHVMASDTAVPVQNSVCLSTKASTAVDNSALVE
jgi:hypothetical protein